MKEILKALNISEKAIEVYLTCFGNDLLTFKEIHLLNEDLSKNILEKVVNELIQNKLLIKKSAEDKRVLDHYFPVAPLSAIKSILNSLPLDTSSEGNTINKELRKSISNIFSKDNPLELATLFDKFQKIKDDVEEDSKKIKEEISELVDGSETKEISLEFLDKFQEELKNLISSQLAGILIVLLQLKADFQERLKNVGITDEQWNSIKDDIKNALALETHQKTLKINEIIVEEFNEIREKLKELFQKSLKSQFEQNSIYLGILNFFRNHILKLDQIITKKKNDYNDGIFKLEDNLRKTVGSTINETFNAISSNINFLGTSFSDILKNYEVKDKFTIQDIWPIRSMASFKEEISNLLQNSKNELFLIVPEIEKYLPIEQFQLDLSISEVPPEKFTPKTKSSMSQASIGFEQKKILDEKFQELRKDAGEKKGFELSHNVADMIAIISEANDKSVVLGKMKNWLNRLLVIRKHLDSNLQYKLMEDSEKWQKDYLNIEKEEPKPISKELEDKEAQKLTGAPEGSQISVGDLYIRVISSENHRNNIVLAFHKSENLNYRKIKKNNILGILSDNSYLIIGIPNKIQDNPLREIIGFGTHHRMFIDAFAPFLLEKWELAKPRKHEQITDGFNDILTHINDYEGRKIGDLLQCVLDVAFKTKGISLDILEIKLLVSRLKKIVTPLDNNMKKEVSESIEELNEKLSGLQLIEAPELAMPKKEKKEVKTTLEQIAEMESPEEEIDIERISQLFDLFLEKIDSMRGVQIGDQIENLIDLVIKLQGFSAIVKWKNQLGSVKTLLDGAAIGNIKEDFMKWKASILKPKVILPTIGIQPTIAQTEYRSGSDAKAGTSMEQTLQEIDKILPQDKLKEVEWSELDYIAQNLHQMKGFEISRKLQDFMDDMLETHGYSMGLKDMKEWISRFRLIRAELEESVINEFIPVLNQWVEKYSNE